MSNSIFVLALRAGAALMAVWIHVRFPSLAPERLGRTVLHLVAAFAVVEPGPECGVGVQSRTCAIFCVVLPALVYALLCTIWMLKLAQTALGAALARAGAEATRRSPTCDAAALALARGELDDGLRAAPARPLATAQRRLDPDHDLLAVEEDDVDREAHEERVNRPRRAEEDSLAGGEAAPAEQAAHPRERARRHEQLLADDAPVLSGSRLTRLRSQRGCGLRGRAAGTKDRPGRAARSPGAAAARPGAGGPSGLRPR